MPSPRSKNRNPSQSSYHVPSFAKTKFNPKKRCDPAPETRARERAPRKKLLKADEAYTERVQNLRREYWKTIGEVQLADARFY